jgi:DNA repair protein RecO (recombination protein O)
MIVKTPAILLRTAATGNTSKVLTWLTPQYGRVATMVKGALRPKSWFLGQFDLFYTCELLYYARHDRELMIARECCPLNPRPALRHHWRACAAASYFTDLAMRISPPHAPQTALYAWLENALNELNERGLAEGLVYWEELRLLKQLGLAPRLHQCMQCRTALGADSNASFSSRRGGLLCPRCAREDRDPALPVPADVLAMLQHWQQTPDPQLIRRVRLDRRQTALMERLLGEFLRHHLDLPLPSRDLAFSIIRR